MILSIQEIIARLNEIGQFQKAKSYKCASQNLAVLRNDLHGIQAENPAAALYSSMDCDAIAEMCIASNEVIAELRAEHAAEIAEYEAALDAAETERNKLVAFLEQLQATVTEWEQTSHSNVTKSKCGQIDHKIKVALAQLSRYAPSQSV